MAGAWSAVRSFTPQPAPPPATLSTFSTNPETVEGGNVSFGTVVLSSGAPEGGALITLSSSNPAVASVPPNATAQANDFTAGFEIATSPVSVNTTVTLTASYNNATRTATVTVTPPASQPPAPTLQSLTLNPTSVAGGSTSQGAVTLSGGAPQGGAVVSLLSGNTAAAEVPASATVAAGATSATFTVATKSVSSSATVTISGTYNTTKRAASLAVTAAGSGPLPAPSLLRPSVDARFRSGTTIAFDWTDVAGAASYTIQIDNSQSFSVPLTVEASVAGSQYSTSSLPTTRMWFRVRANDASGAPGAWSAVRRFEVRQ